MLRKPYLPIAIGAIITLIVPIFIFDRYKTIVLDLLSNQVILNGLIVILLGFFAVLILAIGMRKRRRNLNALGLAVLLFSVFLFLDRFSEYAEKFSAWAALAVAIAAFAAIDENRRLRDENKKREEIRRKEGLLNEIIEWAKLVGQCGFETDPDEPDAQKTLTGKLSEANALRMIEAHRKGFENGFSRVLWLNGYIIKITASEFGGNLHKAVNDLIIELDKHLSMLHEENSTAIPSVTAKEWSEHNLVLTKLTRHLMQELGEARINIR